MTEKQQARRAEVARENGAKSRGPASDIGKYISSLNSISTGDHLDSCKEELPECIALLSTDCRSAYLRLYQKHVRQYQPQSECQLTMLRHMCVELFQLERTISLETQIRQHGVDDTLRSYDGLSDTELQMFSYERGLQKEKLWRSLQREKKAHQTAYTNFVKLFKLIQRDFPLAPPEPINNKPDANLLADPSPPPEVVAEILGHAERAKNEPSYKLPHWVAEVLLNKELMTEIAPGYDVEELLEKLTAAPVPLAA